MDDSSDQNPKFPLFQVLPTAETFCMHYQKNMRKKLLLQDSYSITVPSTKLLQCFFNHLFFRKVYQKEATIPDLEG